MKRIFSISEINLNKLTDNKEKIQINKKLIY
jgi:hypothetical protein